MQDIRAIVFDLYGTLFDVHTVAEACERHYPQRGLELSLAWRQKQLEYTWLRSLMARYANFEQVTEDALVHCCRRLGLPLDHDARAALRDAYLRLDAFPEVPAALHALRGRGLPLAILSNGTARSIAAVVRHAGLEAAFDHLLSVDAAGIYKPDARTYALAERALGVPRGQVLFVSSNGWDATGAARYGFAVCWINRSGTAFEELGERPTLAVGGLDELVGALPQG